MAEQPVDQPPQVVLLAEALERGRVVVNDNQNQHQSVNHVLQNRKVARENRCQFEIEEGNQRRRNDGTVDASHAAQHHHDQNLDGVIIAELRALHHVVAVAVEHARNARKEGGNGKDQQLVFRYVDSGCARRNFAVADRRNRAPVSAADQVLHHRKRDKHQNEFQNEQRVAVVARRCHTKCTAESLLIRVLKNRLDNLAERKRHNGKVVPLETERGKPDDHAAQRRNDSADQNRKEQGGYPVPHCPHQHDRQLAAEIRTHAHKARVPEAQLPEETDHKRERHRQNDADADLLEQELRALIQPARNREDAEQNRQRANHGVVDIVLPLDLLLCR